jgi:sulfur-oxidizing protein SoxY
VVEAEDGSLWMSGQKVKTSGLGACAAPPVTDPAIAMQSIGRIEVAEVTEDVDLAARATAMALGTAEPRRARVAIQHPSHSGMQMDQISLLYIPAHFVETVEVWEGAAPLFTMTGSISLSENPEFQFTISPGTEALRVRVTDTEDGVYEGDFALGAS